MPSHYPSVDAWDDGYEYIRPTGRPTTPYFPASRNPAQPSTTSRSRAAAFIPDRAEPAWSGPNPRALSRRNYRSPSPALGDKLQRPPSPRNSGFNSSLSSSMERRDQRVRNVSPSRPAISRHRRPPRPPTPPKKRDRQHDKYPPLARQGRPGRISPTQSDMAPRPSRPSRHGPSYPPLRSPSPSRSDTKSHSPKSRQKGGGRESYRERSTEKPGLEFEDDWRRTSGYTGRDRDRVRVRENGPRGCALDRRRSAPRVSTYPSDNKRPLTQRSQSNAERWQNAAAAALQAGALSAFNLRGEPGAWKGEKGARVATAALGAAAIDAMSKNQGGKRGSRASKTVGGSGDRSKDVEKIGGAIGGLLSDGIARYSSNRSKREH